MYGQMEYPGIVQDYFKLINRIVVFQLFNIIQFINVSQSYNNE